MKVHGFEARTTHLFSPEEDSGVLGGRAWNSGGGVHGLSLGGAGWVGKGKKPTAAVRAFFP